MNKHKTSVVIALAAGLGLWANHSQAMLSMPSATSKTETNVTTTATASVTNLVITPLTNAWIDLSFWTGARFGSPYTINQNTHQLSPNGNSSDGYLEINLVTRYVMRHGPEADESESDTNLYGKIFSPLSWGMFTDISKIPAPDITATLGYVFANSSGPSNYTASTIIGSSDYYLNASIGIPLFRYCSDKTGSWKQQVSLEFSDGFVTDKKFIQLHHNAFVGLGWQGGFVVNGRQGYWSGRAGFAEIDQPILMAGTNTVVFNKGLNQPIFNQQWVPSTGVTLVVPLTDSINLNAGINSYYSRRPANWNANLGVTFDITKLMNIAK